MKSLAMGNRAQRLVPEGAGALGGGWAVKLQQQLDRLAAQLCEQSALLGVEATVATTPQPRPAAVGAEPQENVQVLCSTEALDCLAGSLAHDLNNLLMVIDGFTDLLIRELPPEGRHGRFLSEIRTATDRAEQLTEALLIYSGKQEFLETEVNLGHALRDVQARLDDLPAGSATVRIEYPNRPPSVLTDPALLEQSIVNLIINAVEAMPNGGTCTCAASLIEVADGSVESKAGVAPGQYARLTVTDTGRGMDPEVASRSHEPFYTHGHTAKHQGLGLSLALGTVRKSHGYLLCRSAPGKGSAFSILLPAEVNNGDDGDA